MSLRVRLSRALTCAAVGAILLVVACSDGRDASTLTGTGSPTRELREGLDLEQSIFGIIRKQFPASTQPVLIAKWTEIIKKVKRDAGGVSAPDLLVILVEYIRAQTPTVQPLPGMDQEGTVAHLALLLSLYVHGGPATPPPVITGESDIVLEVVSPGETETVQTPSEDAGVIFPAGAVNTPTIVVITKNDDPFPEECSGPLPTSRCQYPEFYKFSVFPDVPLNVPAIVSVCHVNAGDSRLPRADHDRFRFAHQKPSNPDAYVEGGTIEGEIEILPLVTTEGLTECEGTEHHHAFVPAGAGLVQRLAIHSRFQAGRALRAVGEVLAPKLAYARRIDRGGGGTVRMFSDFAVVDPQSQAELFVPGTFTTSASAVRRGHAVTVNAFEVHNSGTGPAGGYVNQLVLATNASLSQNVVVLATLPVFQLNPEVVMPVPATEVTIPASTAAGNYFIGVRLDGGQEIPELNEENNVRSVALAVTDPTAPDRSLSAGDRFNCALNETGRAFCWGFNGGRLGNGSTENSATPVPVSQGDVTFSQISAGGTHACAVSNDALVYCWGTNANGQLGNGTTTLSLVPVIVGGETPLDNVTEVRAGTGFTCALRNGQTYCWGVNNQGQLGNGTMTGQATTPQPVPDAPTFTRLASGLWVTCGVTASGAGYCWGQNGTYGSVGNGTNGPVNSPALIAGNHTWRDVQPGAATTCGTTNEGVYCWGGNFFGARGDGGMVNTPQRTPAIVTGNIDFAGGVWSGVGNNVFDPSCALTGQGAAYCWGANLMGALGTTATTETCTFGSFGTFGCSSSPLPVATDLRFLTISVGAEQVCAVTTTRDIACWGRRSEGQLGDGSFEGFTSTPSIVPGIRVP